MLSCFCVVDVEDYFAWSSVLSFCYNCIFFFQFESISISRKLFTIQDFLSFNSCACWSCFISVSEDTICFRIFYSRNQLTLTVIYYIHFNCVRFSWVSHTWLCSCFFSDSVSVLACFCVVDVEDNFAWSSVLSSSYNFICIFFFQFESISNSYKFFTIQDFLSLDCRACWSGFISVSESKIISTCCSCNKLTLAVIFNDYCYFISIWIVFNSGYITCFFRDSECTSFFFCEGKFWELNLTVCIVWNSVENFSVFFQLKFKLASLNSFTVQDFLGFKLKFCFFSSVCVCKFFLRIFKFDAC